ncbi:MAG TPA: sugar nucleotide-binding protein, partial [Verrucomicrobiae bacterium]|nr:sugar nucleotide-binding protein [Verrucomicrobiae bacterium]
STSYVFDGAHGPYTEDAAPNPVCVYAKSKLHGEQRVCEASENGALIPRVICVYGAEAQRKNFAYQVLRAMHEGKLMTLPADQCGNPTYAGDVARWLLFLLERRDKGVWHLAGPWPDCTRPEWAEKLATAYKSLGVMPHPDFGWKPVPTAELKQRALRPLKAGMLSGKAAPA